ncbi:MAG: YeeE/YedE family protein [Noviherbaspirillum sp.]
MQMLMALLAGLVFGLGLIVSGMTDPARIIAFLDLAGNWNPSLAFVMCAAVAVGLIAFRFAGSRSKTLLGGRMHLPTASKVDRRLLSGSLVFGAGWGIAGYCPGPVLTSLFGGGSEPWIFMSAMLAGMALFELLERRSGVR